MAIWNKFFGSNGHTDHSIETIQRNLADGTAVMLDVRGHQERDAGCLKDSIFIPIMDIKDMEPGTSSLSSLSKDVIVYCH